TAAQGQAKKQIRGAAAAPVVGLDHGADFWKRRMPLHAKRVRSLRWREHPLSVSQRQEECRRSSEDAGVHEGGAACAGDRRWRQRHDRIRRDLRRITVAVATTTLYNPPVPEEFTPDERERLAPYFTNVDR